MRQIYIKVLTYTQTHKNSGGVVKRIQSAIGTCQRPCENESMDGLSQKEYENDDHMRRAYQLANNFFLPLMHELTRIKLV
jgi:hypothetical protein